MKFLKLIALLTALLMILAFAVSCDKGEGGKDNGSESGSSDVTTAAPFLTTIKVTALDENGENVTIIDEEDVEYNGTQAFDSLTIFEIVADYCFLSDIECTLDEDTGRFVSIDGHSIAEGGVMWTYKLNGEELSDYDVIVPNGAEIVVTMVSAD